MAEIPDHGDAPRPTGMQLLLSAARPYRRVLAAGMAGTMAVVALRLALPWPLRGIMEVAFPGVAGRSSGLAEAAARLGDPVIVLCASYLALAVGVGLSELAQRVWLARFSIRTVHDLRAAAVAAAGEGDPRPGGGSADLITRIIGDSARLKNDLRGILVHVSQNGLLVVAVSILFLAIAPMLGVVFLAGSTVAILIGYVTVEEVAETARKQRKKESRYAELIETGALDDEDEELTGAVNLSSAKTDLRTTRLIGRSAVLGHAAMAVSISLGLWIGVGDVRAGTLAPGELFLFIAYALTVHQRAVRIGRQTARAGKVVATAERLGGLIGLGDVGPMPLPPLGSAIRLERVRLAATDGRGTRTRLGPVDLTIPRGAHVAILGREGSGKSSLLDVVAGNVRPARGRIWWDDVKVTKAQGALAATVASVDQEPEFGRGAVKDLLGLAGGSEGSDEQLDLLGRLGALKIVERLERGTRHVVSSATLSLRERRILALSRVALGESNVWVLDEPVESDGPRDTARLEAILERGRGRTVLVGLRRAWMIDRFDLVVALRKRKIAFAGTPAEWKAWKERA